MYPAELLKNTHGKRIVCIWNPCGLQPPVRVLRTFMLIIYRILYLTQYNRYGYRILINVQNQPRTV